MLGKDKFKVGDRVEGLVNDLHLIAAQGETPDGDGVTVNVQLWADRWIERLAQQPVAEAQGSGEVVARHWHEAMVRDAYSRGQVDGARQAAAEAQAQGGEEVVAHQSRVTDKTTGEVVYDWSPCARDAYTAAKGLTHEGDRLRVEYRKLYTAPPSAPVAGNPALCPVCKTWPVDGSKCPRCGNPKPFVQQPAAVDVAMAEEALRAWFETEDWRGLLTGIERADRCIERMRAALTAALTTQPGGSDNDNQQEGA